MTFCSPGKREHDNGWWESQLCVLLWKTGGEKSDPNFPGSGGIQELASLSKLLGTTGACLCTANSHRQKNQVTNVVAVLKKGYSGPSILYFQLSNTCSAFWGSQNGKRYEIHMVNLASLLTPSISVLFYICVQHQPVVKLPSLFPGMASATFE